MSDLVLGFITGLILSFAYEERIKEFLAFERTKQEIRAL